MTNHNIQTDDTNHVDRDFPLGNYHQDELYQTDTEFKKNVTKKKQEVYDISIINVSNTNKVNCGDLGKLLDYFQGIINSLALDRKSIKNNVPEEIKDSSNLVFSKTFRDPFTIRLVDDSKGQLLPKTKIDMYGEEFIKLLSLIENSSTIIENIQKYNNLTKKRFTNLLSLLVVSDLNLKIRWAIDSAEYHSNKIITRRSDVKASLHALQKHQGMAENTITFKANLVGISIEKDYFELELKSGDIMRGKLDKSLKHRYFNVPSLVNAKVLETAEFSDLLQTPKYYYSLLNIERI